MADSGLTLSGDDLGFGNDAMIYDIDITGDSGFDLGEQFPAIDEDFDVGVSLKDEIEAGEKMDDNSNEVNDKEEGEMEKTNTEDNNNEEKEHEANVVPDDLFGFDSSHNMTIGDDFDFFGGGGVTDDFAVIDTTYDDPFARDSFTSTPDSFYNINTPETNTPEVSENLPELTDEATDVLVVEIDEQLNSTDQGPFVPVDTTEDKMTITEDIIEEKIGSEAPTNETNEATDNCSLEVTVEGGSAAVEDNEAPEKEVDVIPSDLFDSVPFDAFAASEFDSLADSAADPSDGFDFFNQQQDQTSEFEDPFGFSVNSSQTIENEFEDPFGNSAPVNDFQDPFSAPPVEYQDPFDSGSIPNVQSPNKSFSAGQSFQQNLQPNLPAQPSNDVKPQVYTPPVSVVSPLIVPENNLRSTSTPQGITLFTPPTMETDNSVNQAPPSFQPVGYEWSEPTEEFEFGGFSSVSLDNTTSAVTSAATGRIDIFQGDDSGIELPRSPHAIASFGFGGKLFVCHNNAAPTIKTHSIKQIVAPSSYFKELNSYPGPLDANSSKSKVLSFLQAKITKIQEDLNTSPEESMLWELLSILVEAGEATSFVNDTNIRGKVLELLKSNNEEWLSGAGSNKILKEIFVDQYSKESVLQDVQQRLESGDQSGAFELALQNQLYEHSLIIGSILGPTHFSRAVTMFVGENLTEECPLSSIYKLCTDQSSANGNLEIDQHQLAQKWKNHVSLLISGSNRNWQVTVGRLGDTLWQQHRNVVAAHFCYLLAGVKFQELSQSNARVVLVGGDHKRTNSFARPSTIEYSEILEFVHLQTNPKNYSPSLARYKLVMAGWLADLGLLDRTKNYLKQIQQGIKQMGQQHYDKEILAKCSSFQSRLQNHGQSETSAGWNFFGKVVTSIIGNDETPPPVKTFTAPSLSAASQPQQNIRTPIHMKSVSPMNPAALMNPMNPASPMNPMNPTAPTNSGGVAPLAQSQPQVAMPGKITNPFGEPEPSGNTGNASYDPFGFDGPLRPSAPDPVTPTEKPKPSISQSTSSVEKIKEEQEKQGERKGSSSGIFGWFSSFIPKKTKAMDLGGGSQMRYSEKHKLWIPAGEDEDVYAASKKKSTAPPPPMSASQPSITLHENPAPLPMGTSTPPVNTIASSQGNLIAPRASSSRRRHGQIGQPRAQSVARIPALPTAPNTPPSFTLFTPPTTTTTTEANTGFTPPSFEFESGECIIPDALAPDSAESPKTN